MEWILVGWGVVPWTLGKGHGSRLHLERPNIPTDEHPAEVNREKQVSYGLFQPSGSIHDNLKNRSLQRLPQKT